MVGARPVAEAVLSRASHFAKLARPAIVNGQAGLVVTSPHGQPLSVIALTVTQGRIVAIDLLASPEKLQHVPRNPGQPQTGPRLPEGHRPG